MSQDLEGVTVPTIQDYMKYLESANLIYISEQLNSKGTKVLKNKPGNIGYYRESKNDKEIDIVTNSVKENI